MRGLRLAIAATTLVTLPLASSAAQAARPLDQGRASLGPAAVSVTSSRITTVSQPGWLTVSVPGRSDRALPAPVCSGSTPLLASAASREVIVCSSSVEDLVTGSRRQITVGRLEPSYPGDNDAFEPRLLGTRWIAGTMQANTALGSNATYPVVVERATGRVVRVSTFAATRYLNLDAARPDQPLCAPLRQTPQGDNVGPFGDLVKVGDWTLRTGPAPGASYRQVLQRCGTRRGTSFPAGARAALGQAHIAWVTGNVVHLQTLATGRTRLLSLARAGRAVLGFSANRLVISQPSGDSGWWQIFTIPTS